MSDAMGSASDVAVSTVMMALLFGTNALLYILFQAAKPAVKAIEDKKDKEKYLSKPFIGSIDCFANITTELFRCGLIMALTYICEKHWFFQHSGKEYSRDLFLFVLILFFGYAFYTIKPIHDLSLLGREQTEEWKGWMQFIFLLYHYFHAEEVYNSVRVMITCYVWMTGFGNFSFFYMKQDYGWLRVAQMMWRLNFAVLLLMWTHGNTYILYYICPMHTFYFLMVYATMFIFSSVNHSKWGVRVKLMVLGILIYIIWDVNNGIFDSVFSFLGTESIVGAKAGSVWEYYFRTSLDHWSSFLGMIFALNFPLAEQYFHKAKGWPLVAAAVAIGAATIWWLVTCYTLDKLSYNLSHSYFAIIPLTSYIFFRNITPSIRSGVSMSLHDLGKTTLETYLLQHHIWLTSNAKTLLTIVPGHPWINFALATVLFFTVSKELYRITMSLRGMIMPDDQAITTKNIIGMAFILLINFAVATLLQTYSASLLEVCLACLALLLVSILCIGRFARATADNFTYQLWSGRIAGMAGLLLVLGMLAQLLLNGYTGRLTPKVAVKLAAIAPSVDCHASVSTGRWYTAKCPEPSASNLEKIAFCETNRWIWTTPSGCPVGSVGVQKARNIFNGKKVVFLGDSVVRNVFYQFNNLMVPDSISKGSFAAKHSDISLQPALMNNSTFEFYWAPMVSNITAIIRERNIASGADLVVIGSAAWHALHVQDIASYSKDLTALNAVIQGTVATKLSPSSATSASIVWLQPTTVVDANLVTPEKLQYMPEATIAQYRKAFLDADLSKTVTSIVDPSSACTGREATDGIHYGKDVYKVIAQMAVNSYILRVPALYTQNTKKKPYVPKKTGSMSFPTYGAVVLALAAIMLFSMDSFLGIGFLSLALFGRFADWEAAYGPLHKKILRSASGNISPDKILSSSSSPIESENLLGGSKSDLEHS